MENADTLTTAALVISDNARAKRECPADFYQPHHTVMRSPSRLTDAAFDRKGRPSGQLQFHQSKHRIRVAAPGNGWGGSSAMAAEVDAWCRHTNRWQVTPAEPIVAIWFAPEFRQFAMVLRRLRKTAFGTIPHLKQSSFGGPQLIWPDGSTLFLASYDRSWTHFQGTEPHLAVFDELPPAALWDEMLQRSRGNNPCRFICKATQTQGWVWMADDIYLPWLKFHEKRGKSEEQAMVEQLHPDYWVWPRGGIHDNTGLSDADVQWYERKPYASSSERKVRLYGGFESINAHCIFDEDALQFYKAAVNRQGRPLNGSFIAMPQAGSSNGHSSTVDVLNGTVEELKGRSFAFQSGLPWPNVRTDIFELPNPEHRYVLGFDAAYGIPGRDWDAISVFDKNASPLPRQVAEVQGYLGPARLANVVYALSEFYGGTFIVGERQVGLHALLILYDKFLCRWLYYNRDKEKRNAPPSAVLGHAKIKDDPLLHEFRTVIFERDVQLASVHLVEQMERVQFREPTISGKPGDERREDDDLKIKMSGGGSPDLVMASMYAVFGLSQVGRFERPKSEPEKALEIWLGEDKPAETGWIHRRKR